MSNLRFYQVTEPELLQLLRHLTSLMGGGSHVTVSLEMDTTSSLSNEPLVRYRVGLTQEQVVYLAEGGVYEWLRDKRLCVTLRVLSPGKSA